MRLASEQDWPDKPTTSLTGFSKENFAPLSLTVVGEGEVVSVTGKNILSWKVDSNILTIDLNEAMDREGAVSIKTQFTLDSLPVKISPLRLEPRDSIRHAGFVRLVNQGSVRIDPSALQGLTQLSPDKFPAKPIQSRQVYVFRFPSAAYQFDVSCDRIQPEVHVSEISLHQISEAERTLTSAVQLEIREAPIREWDIRVPEDYSVVSVTGADVSDYVDATEASDGTRNLKVIFSNDVTGRKLVHLVLEKKCHRRIGGLGNSETDLSRIENGSR